MKLFFTIVAAIITAAVIIAIVYGSYVANEEIRQRKIALKMQKMELLQRAHDNRELAGVPPDPSIEEELAKVKENHP